MNDRRSGDLGERVSALEQAVGHIDAEVKSIRNGLNEGFSELSDRLTSLADKMSEANRPHILGWAGWAAVLLILLGMIGRGYVRDIERLESGLSELESKQMSVVDPVQNRDIELIHANIYDLEKKFIREIDQKYGEIRGEVAGVSKLIEDQRTSLDNFKLEISEKVSKNTAFVDSLRKRGNLGE